VLKDYFEHAINSVFGFQLKKYIFFEWNEKISFNRKI